MTFIQFRYNNEEVSKVVFPTTEYMESNVLTVQAYNPTDEVVELIPNEITDDRLKIIQYPKTVEPKQSGLIQLEFTAREGVIKSLQSGALFREILGRV